MNIFRHWLRPPTEGSGTVARDRLKLVLVHDRLAMSPETLDSLKRDMITVLSRYFDIDQSSLAVSVQRGQGDNQLVTSISVKRRRQS